MNDDLKKLNTQLIKLETDKANTIGRQYIKQNIKNIDIFELFKDKNIVDVIDSLQKTKNEYQDEYLDLEFDVIDNYDYDNGYDDDCSSLITINGLRHETDKEYNDRILKQNKKIASEIADIESQIESQIEYVKYRQIVLAKQEKLNNDIDYYLESKLSITNDLVKTLFSNTAKAMLGNKNSNLYNCKCVLKLLNDLVDKCFGLYTPQDVLDKIKNNHFMFIQELIKEFLPNYSNSQGNVVSLINSIATLLNVNDE